MAMTDILDHRRATGRSSTLTLNRPDVRNAFNEQRDRRADRVGRAIAPQPRRGVARRRARGRRQDVLRGRRRRVDGEDDRLHAKRRTCATRARCRGCSRRSNGCRCRSSAASTAPRSAAAPASRRCATSSSPTSDAMFGFTEVKLGILPAVISPFVLAKIGRSAARELFLTGARFSAARAQEIGLVHAVGAAAASSTRRSTTYVREILAARARSGRRREGADPRRLGRTRPATRRRLTAERASPRGASRRRPGRPARVSREAASRRGHGMIRRLLIANRGEIALRIIRACREMGIESVAVYSDADARRAARRAPPIARSRIGPAPAAESYLYDRSASSTPRARPARTPSIPATGSCPRTPRSPRRARRRASIFVGPPAAAIAQMGSKIDARAADAVGRRAGRARRDARRSERRRRSRRRSTRVGFPALVKASAGGGGKGMRDGPRRRDELATAIQAARREAQAAFGDGTLYVERLDRAAAPRRSAGLRRRARRTSSICSSASARCSGAIRR